MRPCAQLRMGHGTHPTLASRAHLVIGSTSLARADGEVRYVAYARDACSG